MALQQAICISVQVYGTDNINQYFTGSWVQ